MTQWEGGGDTDTEDSFYVIMLDFFWVLFPIFACVAVHRHIVKK